VSEATDISYQLNGLNAATASGTIKAAQPPQQHSKTATTARLHNMSIPDRDGLRCPGGG
jgi:hypothetical protein